MDRNLRVVSIRPSVEKVVIGNNRKLMKYTNAYTRQVAANLASSGGEYGYIEIMFADMSECTLQLNISDTADVAQWNAGLTNQKFATGLHDGYTYSDAAMAFTSVEVDGDTVKLYGDMSAIQYLVLFHCGVAGISLPEMPNLEILHLSSNSIEAVDFPFGVPSLKYLTIEGNNVANFNMNFDNTPDLTYLSLGDNNLDVFEPDTDFPVGLRSLNLSSSNLTAFNPQGTLPSTLEELLLAYNANLNDFDCATYWSPSFKYLTFAGCSLDVASVNAILAKAVAGGFTELNLNMVIGTNAAPTGAGITNKQTLIDLGNTVYTN